MRRIKLLVADDELLVSEYLARIIKEEQLPVSEMLVAESGPEAVFLALLARPHLVLLDWRLPGFSGREALSLMIRNSSRLKIVLIAADQGGIDMNWDKKGLSLTSLPKPMGRNKIVRLIRDGSLAALEKEPGESKALTRIRAVISYIEDRLSEALTLEGLARTFALTPQYLSRSFAEVLGRGLKAHLQSRRLVRAAELLRQSDLGLAEIAGRSGFGNQRYLAACFKAQTGKTPREYRRWHRQNASRPAVEP
ncbi:MAG: helix-turn-helix domain-containing protein [Candidatus Adiutrix sp.]|jgi:YesN/AraC family two-component response regulator|nr:helix-turn-helix domain-containing protein [Candidatus Adiutrix sp.]